MHVLRNMVDAVKPGGLVFDLQVIRPNPIVETDGLFVCAIDGDPLFRDADVATAAIDELVASGELIQEAVDDHEVRKHYANGAELVDDFAGKRRGLPEEAQPQLRALTRPCAVRERCRLRRLLVN